jgi:hypothetical protein
LALQEELGMPESESFDHYSVSTKSVIGRLACFANEFIVAHNIIGPEINISIAQDIGVEFGVSQQTSRKKEIHHLACTACDMPSHLMTDHIGKIVGAGLPNCDFAIHLAKYIDEMKAQEAQGFISKLDLLESEDSHA